MYSETVCPFCGDRRALETIFPESIPFEGYADLDVYRCDCGAVGCLYRDTGRAPRPLDDVESALCRGFLPAHRDACRLDRNYVTATTPPLLVLWAMRRAGAPGTEAAHGE